MHCIFDGVLEQYNFCWVETWIIGATRRSLDLRNILSSEQVLVKLYSAHRVAVREKLYFYVSILFTVAF